MAGGALSENVPTSDVPCRAEGTGRSAPADDQRVMLSSRSAAHRDPLASGLFHGHPVRGHPLPSPEHLPSCTEPRGTLALCSRFASSRCVPRGCVARTLSPCLCSAALITRRRFLQARHPSSSSSLERWTHRGTEALPTDVCHPTTSLPKLHPCSRRSTGLPGSHPVRPRRSWFTPGRSCFGGAVGRRGRGIRPRALDPAFTSDVLVATVHEASSLSARRIQSPKPRLPVPAAP